MSYDMEYNCLDWLKPASSSDRRAANQQMSNDIAILCLNVQGDANLGNMMRTACLFGAHTFYLAGRKKWDKRYSVGAHHYMDVVYLPDVFHVRIDTHHPLECTCGVCKTVDNTMLIDFLKNKNYTPCFIEQGGTQICDPVWKHTIANPIFIYGNETNGIPQETLRQVRRAIPTTQILSIPQHGVMRSHNVATTCTIALWEYFRHVHSSAAGL